MSIYLDNRLRPLYIYIRGKNKMKLTAARQAKIERTCCRYLDSLGYTSPVRFLLTRKDHEAWKHNERNEKSYLECIQGGYYERGRSSAFLGVCYSDENVIYLNVKHAFNWKSLDDTIRHELVHLVRKYNHRSMSFGKCMKRLKAGTLIAAR